MGVGGGGVPWWPFTKIVQAVMICPKIMAARGRGLFSLYIYIENFKNLLVRNQWTDFNITWQECVLVTLYQGCSSRHDSSKNRAARGRALFSLYIYKENFKNLLVRNRWTELNVTRQVCCFGDLLPSLFKPSWYVKKTWPPVYICIENFKILLVEYPLTDFNITWLECCFGDPLPRLFKQSWFIKNMAARGWGLFSLYI